MTDDFQTELQQDFAGLSETETLFAAVKMQADFLYETQRVLGMYDTTAGAEQIYGLKEEVARALELAKHNLAVTLQKISERDIERLHREGVISEYDFTEAIKTKRALELSRSSSSPEQER